MEEWKEVKDFEERFLVSSLGRIKSKKTSKILKLFKHSHGYLHFSTRIGGRSGKSYCFKVHRLVAQAFVGNSEGKPFVNHIDGDKTNNSHTNLEWCTNKENVVHAFKTGLAKGRAQEKKLSLESRKYIKSVYKPYCKEFGSRALAKKFKINKNTIVQYTKEYYENY